MTNKILALTCSGGGAAMVADNAEDLELKLPNFRKSQKKSLDKVLPKIATISNPLDYTTPVWGIPEKTGPVFKNALKNDYSTAILVQDFPNAQINETEQLYLNDTKAFIDECKLVGLTPIICSTLPENINENVGNKILRLGGVPMQGIYNCLNAVRHLLDYNNFSDKKELHNLKKVTRALFNKKRKKISNSLEDILHKESIKKLNLNLNLRPDELSLNEFLQISALVKDDG